MISPEMDGERGVPVREAWGSVAMCGEDTLLVMENSTSVVSDDIIKRKDGRSSYYDGHLLGQYKRQRPELANLVYLAT